MDTVGFSHFHRQRWVRVDYHLIAEVESASATTTSIRSNPLYADTIFGMTRGWMAEAANEMVADRMLPSGSRIFRWRRVARGMVVPPSRHLSNGLVHGAGSVQDTVNFALIMGWRRIVIAGVDLVGNDYFWMSSEAGKIPTERWAQADTVLASFRLWRELAAADGIELLTYSASSLLAEVLPIFEW